MGKVINFRPRRACLFNVETMARINTKTESPRLTRALESKSETTARTYRNAINGFDRWANGRPVSDETLAEYVTHLHETGKSPAYVRVCISGLRFREKALGRRDPKGMETGMALDISRRKGRGRGKGQAPHLTKDQIQKIGEVAVLSGSLWGLRDRAVISTMFAAGLRVSEACELEVRDLECLEDGSGLLTVRFSKTDSEGKGFTMGLSPGPVRHLCEWIERASLRDRDPLFPAIHSKGVDNFQTRIVRYKASTKTMARIVSTRAEAAGFPGVTSHSMRRSFAAHLSLQGLRTHQIQEAGRWTSPNMVLQYTQGARATRSKVVAAMAWE